MSAEAVDALVADLKLWACSPRIPLKAQLVMLEAVGRLSAKSGPARDGIIDECLEAFGRYCDGNETFTDCPTFADAIDRVRALKSKSDATSEGGK